MNRIAISLDAMARSQLATAMDRAQTKNDRADAEKAELYQREDELDVELKDAKEGLDLDAHWTKKAAKGIGGFFGFGDFDTKKANDLEKLSVDQKRVQTELSQVKGEQSRAMRNLGEAVDAAQGVRSTVSRTVEDSKAVAAAKHEGSQSLASASVAGKKVLRVESAQTEMAAEMVQTATEGADRARAEETRALGDAADRHEAALNKHSDWSFGLQLKRLANTVIPAANAVVAALPMSPIGVVTPAQATQLAVKMLAGVVGTVPVSATMSGVAMSGKAVNDGNKSAGKAEAAEIEVTAALSAERADSAERRRQGGLRLAQEARDTVSQARDHNRQVRV